MPINAFIQIKATGNEVERFINLCVNHDIAIKDLRTYYDNDGNYSCTFSLLASDYLKTKNLIKKTHTRTVILKKSGLPFTLGRIKKRTLFSIILICCCISLYLIMMRIWRIDISGNFLISDNVFYDFLKENNIYYGTMSRSIDFKEVEEKIREQFSDVTWASVTQKGTALLIEVKEREILPVTIDTTEVGDLIATESGTIESIIVRNGVPLVKAGDVVETGQKLVSCELHLYNDDLTIKETRRVCADADILIKYQKQIVFKLNQIYTRKKYTENYTKKSYLKIGSLYITNPFKKKHFEKEEINTDIKQLCIFDQYYLPAYYGVITQKEYEIERCKYTTEEASNILNEQFDEYLSSLIEKGLQIIEKDVTIELNENIYQLTGSITILENAYERNTY